MWNADSRFVASRDQLSCDIGGETAILNLSTGIYYGLDPVATRVWNSIQQPATLAELENILVNEYDVDKTRAAADLRDLLEKLASARLIDQP